MVRYLYYYGNESLIQDERLMLFCLDPITEEKAELNFVKASTIPIVLGEPFRIPLADEFTYKFTDEISNVSGTFSLSPDAKTLVFDFDGFCQVASQTDPILTKVAADLAISKESAIRKAQDFFSDKTVIVQPGGVQGTVYKVGSYLQSVGSAGLVTQTVTLEKLAGAIGLQILNAQPALAIAIPTTGAIFFLWFGGHRWQESDWKSSYYYR